MSAGTRCVLIGLLVWFCLAFAVGLTGVFENVQPVGVAITVWSLTFLTLGFCFFLPVLREWASSIPTSWLVALHVTRFVGFYFLLLAQRGQLPEGFAQPAGIGDIAVATLALILLAVPVLRRSRVALLTWNSLGFVDILLVVAGALRFGLRDPESMRPLRVLPLSLLPMFLVPLIIATHVLLFIRLIGGGTSPIENRK